MLHKIDRNSPSWPSPRQWVKSNNLLQADLDIDPAVGGAAAAEFRSFCKIYKTLPDIEKILNGNSDPIFLKIYQQNMHFVVPWLYDQKPMNILRIV